MKVHNKITFFIAILFLTTLFIKPVAGLANEIDQHGGQSCGVDRGKDVIFVINDSRAMLAVDISSDPLANDSYVSEAIKYTDNLDKNDRVAVIGFNDKAVNYQSLTDNRYQSDAALNKFLTAGPNTAGGNDLSTGIETALEEFSKNGNDNDKTIIVMTTGDSIENQKSINLARKAYEDHVKIHVFGFGSTAEIDYTNLTRIAQATGGGYYYAPRASYLEKDLANLNSAINNFSGRQQSVDWTLTTDVVEPSGLLIREDVKVNLNGYKLEVKGDLVLLTCAELRARDNVVIADNVDQRSGSVISLNGSRLQVNKTFTQNGMLRVNGNYGGASVAEMTVNHYNQKIRGALDLAGRTMNVTGNFTQEGRVHVAGGKVQVSGNLTQKGFFNVQKGSVYVKGNLNIEGGPLINEENGDEFTKNRSLNVGDGLVEVGSAASMAITRDKGNIRQNSGQLFVNYGTVRVFGDYAIDDGWLTMIKGTMDTTSPTYGPRDGDYVHVYGDFSTSSKRNHMKRDYLFVGKPMHDPAHLTDGVLRVDGSFTQVGNKQYDAKISDRSQGYLKDYSALNFNAANRHKVLMAGSGTISVQSNQFTFNALEFLRNSSDYIQSGNVKSKTMKERGVSSNAKLHKLSINDIDVTGFNPNTTNYYSHFVPAGSATSGVQTLKVDARQDDPHAKVKISGEVVRNGIAEVVIIVTAPDGKTEMVYNVFVTVGTGSDGRVESIGFEREALSFLKKTDDIFSPDKVTIKHTVMPRNAKNQEVIWSSTDEAVATVFEGIVTPVGIGNAAIIAQTVDGNFQASATVTVYNPNDLLRGIDTLADFVSDNDRYNKITELYDLNDVGIVVPGAYIKKMIFPTNNSGVLLGGEIETSKDVERVDVRVNNGQFSTILKSTSSSSTENVYTFSRAGLTASDIIEIIAHDNAGNELERIKTHYPVGFMPSKSIPYGYNSIQKLLSDPYLLDLILDNYSMEQLRFTAR